MDRTILNDKPSSCKLIVYGNNLVHDVFSVMDCLPELKDNPHFSKLYESAKEWNNEFIRGFILKENN